MDDNILLKRIVNVMDELEAINDFIYERGLDENGNMIAGRESDFSEFMNATKLLFKLQFSIEKQLKESEGKG